MRPSNPATQSFDVIVVGAGTAGCVMAGRLSQAGRSVLVIEAGEDTPPGREPASIRDPYPRSYGDARFFWPDLVAEVGALPRCGGARLSRRYEQARIMGGGSSIHGMVALRGLPRDYDDWAALGVHGWGWSEVLPFFRRLEADLDFDGPLHGQDGPVPIRRCPAGGWPPFSRAAAAAAARRGLPFVADFNADFRDGHGPTPMSSTPAGRVSSAMAYLGAAARRRPNLSILTRATARGLVWDGRRVQGVVIDRGGARETHLAQTVVVCAGAIHSPALLMRSGVGPGAALREAGVAVIADRPGVGANLQNHPMVAIAAHLPRASAQPRATVEWGQSMARVSSGHDGCPPGDIILTMVNRASWHPLGRRIGVLGAYLYKAYSRGSVSLRGPDPANEPAVGFNLLSDPRDLARMVWGLRLTCEIMADEVVAAARNEAFLPDGAVVARLNRPKLQSLVESAVIDGVLGGPAWLRRRLLAGMTFDPAALAGDDEALEDVVRARAGPSGHPAGTCRMGAADDPAAVLDSRCRVLGVEGLRVVDGSVMPTLVSANTNVPIWMIGEKGADMLIQDGGRG